MIPLMPLSHFLSGSLNKIITNVLTDPIFDAGTGITDILFSKEVVWRAPYFNANTADNIINSLSRNPSDAPNGTHADDRF